MDVSIDGLDIYRTWGRTSIPMLILAARLR